MGAGAVLAIAGLVLGTGLSARSAAETEKRVAATTALTESTGVHHEQLAALDAVAQARTKHTASGVLNHANQVIAASQDKVDASGLNAATSSLAGFETMPIDELVTLTAQTRAETAAVAAATAEADRVAADAEAARVAALAVSNTPEGARATARSLAAANYGWGAGEFSCLSQLWQKESGWSYTARNGGSGATGIPQALPGSKMASAGSDWASNATTQIAWGLQYIKASSYGSPCAAWSHSQSVGWY